MASAARMMPQILRRERSPVVPSSGGQGAPARRSGRCAQQTDHVGRTRAEGKCRSLLACRALLLARYIMKLADSSALLNAHGFPLRRQDRRRHRTHAHDSQGPVRRRQRPSHVRGRAVLQIGLLNIRVVRGLRPAVLRYCGRALDASWQGALGRTSRTERYRRIHLHCSRGCGRRGEVACRRSADFRERPLSGC